MKNKEIERILQRLNLGSELTPNEFCYLKKYIEQLEKDKQILIRNNNIGNEKLKELQNINKQLEKRIYKARKMIFDNYGVLDKYEIEMLDDILKGDNNE